MNGFMPFECSYQSGHLDMRLEGEVEDSCLLRDPRRREPVSRRLIISSSRCNVESSLTYCAIRCMKALNLALLLREDRRGSVFLASFIPVSHNFSCSAPNRTIVWQD
jgi:hypothetical protein